MVIASNRNADLDNRHSALEIDDAGRKMVMLANTFN